MLGKAKCKILKEIRQKIADENDIPYVTRECTYQGDCSGTCPKCESELRYLERELERREKLGRRVAVTALCTGLSLGAVGCTKEPDNEIAGDMSYAPPTDSPDDEIAGMEDYIDPGEDVNIDLAGETELAGAVAYINEYDEDYEKEALERVEGFGVFASNYGIEDGSELKGYPIYTADKDVKLSCLTTYHWNGGYGIATTHISIYDITDGNEVMLGSWEASPRGDCGSPNINWDIFPDIKLEAGHSYRIEDTSVETWSCCEESGFVGFVELRTADEEAEAIGGTITSVRADVADAGKCETSVSEN